MLSINNIGLNQAASYYGKDDYYTRTSTADDGWCGKLSQKYSRSKDFDLDPQDFDKALKSAKDPRRVGYDLTFSAPKSVSIVMSLDDDKKNDMLIAHNKAVTDTLHEIEANEIEARVTRGGVTERIKTSKMAAAKFQHYVSREQDPQLHTHTVVLNKTVYDGREYAVANENLYKNRRLYGYLYNNRLSSNLQKMGYNLRVTDDQGNFEIKEVSQDIIDKFSKRTLQKNEQLEKLGIDPDDATAADRQKAVLQTRVAKDNRDLDALIKEWRAEIGDVKIEKNLTPTPIENNKEAKQAAFDRAVEKLAEEKYAFSPNELEKTALAEGVLAGFTDRKDFDRFLEKSDLIKLEKIVDPDIVKKYKITPDQLDYYTTEENIVTQKTIMDNVSNSPKFAPLENAEQKLDQMITDKGLTLTAEQKTAVLGIAASTKQYVGVQGLAGTGKTYMLSALHDLVQNNGYVVRGMSFTGKATEGLRDAGIDSTTIHSCLNSLEKLAARNRPPATPAAETEACEKKDWNFDGLQPQKTPELWVVDEAGTANNRLFLNLQKAAAARGAKVVLLGDAKQFQPIGPGNAFEKLTTSCKIDTFSLSDIRRQKNDELLAAVKEAVLGPDVEKSTEILTKNIREIKTAPRRYKAIAREYTTLPEAERDNTVILTATNGEKQAINNIVRTNLIKNGKLNADGQQIEVIEGRDKLVIKQFAIGDKIIFGKNDHKLKILNGQMARIIDLKGSIMTAKTGAGDNIVKIDTDVYKNIDYGYAITSYKSQGITTDRAIINMDSRNTGINTRNAYYVNISRAKYGVSVYTDSQSKLSKQISNWGKKITADDFLIKNFTPKMPKTGSSSPKVQGSDTGLSIPIPPVPGLSVPFKAANIVFKTVVKTTKKVGKLGWKALEKAANEADSDSGNGKLVAKFKNDKKDWDDMSDGEKEQKIMHTIFHI